MKWNVFSMGRGWFIDVWDVVSSFMMLFCNFEADFMIILTFSISVIYFETEKVAISLIFQDKFQTIFNAFIPLQGSFWAVFLCLWCVVLQFPQQQCTLNTIFVAMFLQVQTGRVFPALVWTMGSLSICIVQQFKGLSLEIDFQGALFYWRMEHSTLGDINSCQIQFKHVANPPTAHKQCIALCHSHFWSISPLVL